MHASPVDEQRVAAYLLTDPPYAVYALADLDPPLRAGSGFHLLGSPPRGLVLVYRSPAFDAVFMMGTAHTLERALPSVGLPKRFDFFVRSEHLAVLRRGHVLDPDPPRQMLRMVLRRAAFCPCDELDAERVGAAEAERLDAFYRGRTPAWSPSMLEHGLYAAIRRQGAIVAAAGTHVMSRRWGVAAIGNVLTEPAARGRGFGSAVTSAVARALLTEVEVVVLNVEASNEGAVRIYERLGFETVETLFEATATRRVG